MSTSNSQDNGKRVRERSSHTSQEDLNHVMQPHEDPLVIQAGISHYSRVERMIIDIGSSVYIVYLDTFIRMGLKKEDLFLCKEAIYGFTDIFVFVVGVIELKTSISFKKGRVSGTCWFVMVEVESTFPRHFGTILHSRNQGSPIILSSLHAIFSQRNYRNCQRISTWRHRCRKMIQLTRKDNMLVYVLPDISEREKIEPVDDTKIYKLEKGHVTLDRKIPSTLRSRIISVLEQYHGRFVWEGEAPTQVAWQIVTHKLNVDPSFPAQRQKHQVLTGDRQVTAKKEISKLLNVRHIRLVKKPNGMNRWNNLIKIKLHEPKTKTKSKL